MLTASAPAKVNLVLEVLGRGSQYHDICSIAQTVDLCDLLTFEPARRLEFTCSDSSLTNDNLVPRAAQLLQQRCSVAAGARIHLEKRIPPAQGLGGGSSDAAATLSTLNRLWELGLSRQQLSVLGAELGSDVPLFLTRGTVLLEGRGERVTALPDLKTTHLVLFAPDIRVPAGKTAFMYGCIKPEMYTRGQFVRAAAFALERQGRIPEELMFNVFEKVTADVFQGLRHVRTMLEEATGTRAHLAGAGPCMYALVETEDAAASAVQRLETHGRRAFAVRTTGARDTDHEAR